MRRRIYIILISLSVIFYFSCSDANRIQDNEMEEKEISLSLSFTGEYVTVETNSLSSRSLISNSNTNLYLIQVYYIPKESDVCQPYCYGIFSDVTNLQLKLIEGRSYFITASIIIDGLNELSVYTNLAPNPGDYGTELTSITTNFVKDSDNQIDVMCNFFRRKKNQSIAYYDLPIDVYGTITDIIIPSDTMATINLPMKRFVYGLSVNVSSLSSGSIVVEGFHEDSDRDYFESYVLTENGTYDYIHAMDIDFNIATGFNKLSYYYDLYRIFINETSPCNCGTRIKVKYINAQNEEILLYNEYLTMYRLKKTTLNVTVPTSEELSQKKINLLYDIKDEKFESGENIEIKF